MSDISIDKRREIIKHFEKEIQSNKSEGAKPSVAVIPFRNDRPTNKERKVWEVRTEFLRFRKDNGRIASDIISYERDKGILKEDSETAQEIIKDCLLKKDIEKTSELVNSIEHSGQRDPAVITSDGFLVDGNRRMLSLQRLANKHKDTKYEWMRVVILPGSEDGREGGAPTLKEIEQIENRVQLQSEGKAEYSKFDRALSIRRKIETGMELEEQLRDDPNFYHLNEKEFKRKLKEYKEKYLNPLECIDRYLEWLNRNGLYISIEGRWEAFLDYYSKVWKKIEDENERIKLNNIEENEVGDIEEIAFKIIRKREFPNAGKLHQIMRKLLHWYQKDDSKKALKRILDEVQDNLEPEDEVDENGKELSEGEKDKKWSVNNQEALIRNVKKAKALFEQEKEKETPLNILGSAKNKLYHDQLLPENIAIKDAKDAMKISGEIKKRADELESIFYEIQKGPDKLKEKFHKNK